jgi:hypothetical protein
MLKRGTVKCPKDKEPLHWKQCYGMRLIRMIQPPKPKHVYWVYTATCKKCGKYYEVKK